MIRFKTEVELPSHSLDNLQFFLKVDLMHMEATEDDIKHPGTGPIGLAHNKHLFGDEEWISSKFKCVSSRTYKMNHIITLFKGAAKGMAK
jgi:hypothetical protein